MISWLYLLGAGLFEIVWALALKESHGFSKLWPSVVTVVGMVFSVWLLALALKQLPIGTAYAVWVGIGAARTVVYVMATGAESASIAKIVLIAILIGCVVGLKLVSDGEHAA